MLWLIIQFFNIFLKKFKFKKIQLMIERYFLDFFFFQKILAKVDEKTLIE